MPHNAERRPLPEAGARHERTLETAGWTPWLGGDWGASSALTGTLAGDWGPASPERRPDRGRDTRHQSRRRLSAVRPPVNWSRGTRWPRGGLEPHAAHPMPIPIAERPAACNS